jgi:hypothetical protein
MSRGGKLEARIAIKRKNYLEKVHKEEQPLFPPGVAGTVLTGLGGGFPGGYDLRRYSPDDIYFFQANYLKEYKTEPVIGIDYPSLEQAVVMATAMALIWEKETGNVPDFLTNILNIKH